MARHQNIFFVLTPALFFSCSSIDAGWRAQRHGDYEEAQRHAMIALSKEPLNPDVYRLIASNHLARGNTDYAIQSAEFAVSLDPKNSSSQRILRTAYAQKKDWRKLCQTTNLSLSQSGAFNAGEIETFQEACNALTPSGDAYGCVMALNTMGIIRQDFETIKSNYCHILTQQGAHAQSLEIAKTCANEETRYLIAAQNLYALGQRLQAQDLLTQYLKSTHSHQPVDQIWTIASDAQDWGFLTEILKEESTPTNRIRHAIALRRIFKTQASDACLERYFSDADRSQEQTYSDIKLLCHYGYAQSALHAYETCLPCKKNLDMSIEIATMLHQMSHNDEAAELLSISSLQHSNDPDAQKRLFHWYIQNGYTKQAQNAGELAHNLNPHDETITRSLLEIYAILRHYTAFEHLANQWIEQSSHPAKLARTEIARLQLSINSAQNAIKTLSPLDQEQQLDGDSLKYAIHAYNAIHDAKNLDRLFDQYLPNIDALKRSQYFEYADAEIYYKKSLLPLLTGSGIQKIDALFAMALFEKSYKNDVNSEIQYIQQAIAEDSSSSSIYQRAIRFLIGQDQLELAENYADKYQNQYPNDENSYELLGQIQLRMNHPEKAISTFEKAYINANNKREMLTKIVRDYEIYHDLSHGILWITRLVEKNPDDSDILETRIRINESIYQTVVQKDTIESQLLKDELIHDYNKLISIHPQKAFEVAQSLLKLNDDENAYMAFEIAAPNIPVNQSINFLTQYAYAAIKIGKDEKTITHIINQIDDEKDIFQILDMLQKQNVVYLAKDILKKQLSSKNAKFSDRAFSYLIQIAYADGNTDELNTLLKQRESQFFSNATIRFQLAQANLNIQNWKETLRHLIWLQANRPDSRDLFTLTLELARRTKQIPEIQTFANGLLQNAQGVYHRLNWISQYYQNIGDNANALAYAKQAWQASNIHNDDMRLYLLDLYIKTGNFDSKEAQQHLLSLKTSTLWNTQRIEQLALTAQKNGYFLQAQTLMDDAIALSSNPSEIYRQKLEMALESENQGIISQNLQLALENSEDVVRILETYGAYLNIIDAIDYYEQNGQPSKAIHTLSNFLPYFVDARGIAATKNILWRNSHTVSDASLISDTLAKIYLITNTPCQAFAHIQHSMNPQLWLQFMQRCPDMGTEIIGALLNMRQHLTQRKKNNFDQKLQTILADYPDDIVDRIENHFDISKNHIIRHNIQNNHALRAVSALPSTELSSNQIMQTVKILAMHGFTAEAIDYGKSRFKHMDANDKLKAAKTAILLDHYDDIFKTLLQSAQPHDLSPIQHPENLVPYSQIQRWLSMATTNTWNDAIQLALRFAANDNRTHDEIILWIHKDINKRHGRMQLWLQLGQAAMTHGLYQDAINALETAISLHANAPDAYRTLSLAYAKLHQTQKAWDALLSGAALSNNLDDYWTRATKIHKTSNTELRKKINETSRTFAPRRASAYIEAAYIALAQNELDNAVLFAKNAFQFAGPKILPSIENLFKQFNATSAIPNEIIQNNNASAHMILADRATNNEQKTFHISKAAALALWPLDIYIKTCDEDIIRRDWTSLEQHSAMMRQNIPHSAISMTYSAIYNIYAQHPDRVLQDLHDAQTRSINHAWIGKIIAHAVIASQLDLAKSIINDEILLGMPLQHDAETAYCNVFIDTFPAGMLQTQTYLSAASFIKNNMPSAFSHAQTSTTLQSCLQKLAALANDKLMEKQLAISAL